MLGLWVLLALTPATPAMAADERAPLMLGQWKLWTELALDLQVRNNLHQRHEDDITKALYGLRPSLHLRRDMWDASYFSLDYTALVAVKEDSSPFVDNFSNDDWWSNSLDARLHLGSFIGPYLNCQVMFQRTSDRQGSDNLYRLGLKTSRRYGRAWATLGYAFGLSAKLEATGGYFIREYDAPEADKHNQKAYFGALAYYHRITSQMWLKAEYQFESRDYLDQDAYMQEDFFEHRLMAGVKWEPSGTISGAAMAGMAWRTYRDPVNEEETPFEDGGSWVAQVYMDYEPVSGTRLRLDFTRGLLAAPFGGHDYNYLVSTRLLAEVRQEIQDGVELFALMAVGRWDYNALGFSPRLKDHFLEAGVGFICKLENGAYVQATWVLDHRRAGRDQLSFNDQRYTLTLGWEL